MPTGVYIHTKPAWNKGLTKENDPRLANQGLYDHTGKAGNFPKGHAPWNKCMTKKDDLRIGKQGNFEKSNERRKIAIENLGMFAVKGHDCVWNRGLTKNDHPGIARGAEKVRQHNLGKCLSEETKQKQRGKRGPYRETGRRKESQDIFWANISPGLKSEYIRRSRVKTSKRKTVPEAILEDLLNIHFPREWKYVGQGELIIAGLIPDFTNINGKKQLIEMFGDYWHRDEDPQDRISKFLEYGYDCLVIWESAVRTQPDQVVEHIKKFSKGGTNGSKKEMGSHRPPSIGQA